MSSSLTSPTTPEKDFTTSKYNYVRAGYFLTFGALSAFSPFASVLFESKGFTAFENGLINSFNPFCTLFVIPPIAYLAEVNKMQSKFMYLSAFFSAFFLTIAFLVDDKLIVAVAACGFFACHAPLLPLFDEHTLSILTDEFKHQYGHFRSFGAYSWLAGSLLSSFIIGQLGWKWLSLSVILGFLGLMFCVYKTPVEKIQGEHHYIDVFKHILKTPKLLNFIFALCFIGFGYAIINTFLNLFLISPELDAPPILLGLATVFTVAIEIPLFNNADWLYKHFTDEQLIVGAMFFFVIRVLGYSVLPNCWAVLLLEPNHGLVFGLSWLSATRFFPQNFPDTYRNSAVGFVHASMFGLGPVFAGPVGGYLYEEFGPRKLFQISACMMGIVACCFWFIHQCLGGDDNNDDVTIITSTNQSVENDDLENKRKNKEENVLMVDAIPCEKSY